MHHINHENCNITKRATALTQVRERLVTRGIDHKKTRHLELEIEVCIELVGRLFQVLHWEVSCTNLLCNSTCFAFLYISSTDFVKNLRFACVDMTHDTANRRSEVILAAFCESFTYTCLSSLAGFFNLTLLFKSFLLHSLFGCHATGPGVFVILTRVIVRIVFVRAIVLSWAEALILALFVLFWLFLIWVHNGRAFTLFEHFFLHDFFVVFFFYSSLDLELNHFCSGFPVVFSVPRRKLLRNLLSS
mmetsp:Transcript_3603/g.6281  ORF Transcript_3603/g.6281 Transcript_3603/m.6281 type:complete len:246 (-) Transcript_3603:1022-1759(-)